MWHHLSTLPVLQILFMEPFNPQLNQDFVLKILLASSHFILYIYIYLKLEGLSVSKHEGRGSVAG